MNVLDTNKVNYFFEKSQTRNGMQFDPNIDIWNIKDISGTTNYKFDEFNVSKKYKYGIKNVFKWYLENTSARHSGNMYKYFKNFIMYISTDSSRKIQKISKSNLINYRSHLGIEHEWYLGSLSGFLKRWYKMGDSCLTKDAYNYLEETKFKGNPKGQAVLTMDPIEGPFTDLELESIQVAINNAYADSKIKTEDYILIWLFMIYGSRPIQFAQLKLKDIVFIEQDGELQETFINIPRVKNRKAGRSEFKRRVVPNALSGVLHTYCQQVKARVRAILADVNESPLFLSNSQTIHNEGNYHTMYYHLYSSDIKLKIDKVFNDLNLISERTGAKLHISPIRFRRTIGTRAASEGHGTLIIAEILDHSDTQNAQVYVQSSPEIIERIDRAVAMHLAPLAQAFAGTLVKDKSKALRADDKESDVVNPEIDTTCTPTGKCGSYSYCGQMSPLACYTCSSFQAWTDGPHEAVLDHLIKERERLLQIADYRIASVNDKTIMAVAQVVAECKKYKSENEVEVLVHADH